MSKPYLIELYRGAHLYQEFGIKNSDGVAVDLTNATLSVVADAALFDLDLTATKGVAADGQMYLASTAARTEFANLGIHKAQVWANWSSGSPTDEVLFEVKLRILERPS